MTKGFTSEEINQQGCAWIAKLHGVDPTVEELKQLNAWMARSPAHKAEIYQLATLWGELDVLAELAVAVPEQKRQHNKTARYRFASAAACLLLMVFSVWGISPSWMNERFFQGDSVQLYSTLVGEQKNIQLDDGSKVLLNTDSRLRVHYDDDARHIYLDRGEAHFDVVSNSARPFRVFSGSGMIRTLGTAFSVHLNGSMLEVTVTEGSVEFNSVASDQSVKTDVSAPVDVVPSEAVERLAVLKAGHNALIDPEIKVIKSIKSVDENELLTELSWHDGVLKFSGDPLHEVVEEISRYTATTVVIQDPGIRDVRIGGLFKVGELDKMFEALESSFGVRVDRVSDKLVHLESGLAKSDL